MLVIPFQLAGMRIERQCGVGVKRVVVGAFLFRQQAADFGDVRIGLADAQEQGVGVGIVAARIPGRGAETLLQRQPVPAIAAGLAGLRDGVEAPKLLAVVDVVAGDEAAAGHRVAAAGHALHDDVGGHQWAAGVAPALLVVLGLVVPDHLAGLGVQRDDMRIGGRDDQLVVDHRHVALGGVVAVLARNFDRDVALVFPQQLAVGGIERLHLVEPVVEEKHAVVDQRRRFRGARRHRPAPGYRQVLDVVGVDLFQRAIAPGIVGTAPHQPVVVRRIKQHLRRHWR